MRQYEAVVIASAQPGNEKLDDVKKVFEDTVIKFGGKVTSQRELGKRAFGYQVKKQREGNYIVFDFSLLPAKVSDLKKALTLSEPILRFSLFIKQDIPVREPAHVTHTAHASSPAAKPTHSTKA